MKKIITVALVLLLTIGCAYQCMTFSNLVTNEVIGKAISKLGNGSQVVSDPIFFVNAICRHTVYEKVFGKDWYNIVYYSDVYHAYSEPDTFAMNKGGSEENYFKCWSILEVCRGALRKPITLKTAYLSKKQFLLNEIHRQEKVDRVRYLIRQSMPYFQGPLPENSPNYGLQPSQWVERRRKEGGESLVEMYAWCLDNLDQALATQ